MKRLLAIVIGTILVTVISILITSMKDNATEQVDPDIINSEQPLEGNIP